MPGALPVGLLPVWMPRLDAFASAEDALGCWQPQHVDVEKLLEARRIVGGVDRRDSLRVVPSTAHDVPEEEFEDGALDGSPVGHGLVRVDRAARLLGVCQY